MSPEKLVYMANQIATFFRSQPEEKAVAGVAEHINSFWEPRMRAALLDRVAENPTGIDGLVLKAAGHVKPVKAA